jgi:predicted AAA+ superfamily ATPase
MEQMQGMMKRRDGQPIEDALARQPGVALLGPRQVGKTTFDQEIAETRDAVCLDMERSPDRRILEEPDLYLDEQTGRLVVIDEVQLMPDLFKALRGRIDRRRRRGFRTGQFLLLGSASDTLLHQRAESLERLSSA